MRVVVPRLWKRPFLCVGGLFEGEGSPGPQRAPGPLRVRPHLFTCDFLKVVMFEMLTSV